MQIEIRQYQTHDAAAAAAIWNEVVRGGTAFPQREELTEENADSFFRSQSFTGLAEDAETGEIVGLYILHPNNVGRCGHICNTSYAVKDGVRGRHIGEQLVRHSMAQGKTLGYRILQFNAVVATNASALHALPQARLQAARRHPGRLPHAGRPLRGHHPALSRIIRKNGRKRGRMKKFRRYIPPAAGGKC